MVFTCSQRLIHPRKKIIHPSLEMKRVQQAKLMRVQSVRGVLWGSLAITLIRCHSRH